MPKTIKLSFEIGDKIKIPELNRPGRVVSIHIAYYGIRYECRYFNDGDIKSTYFTQDEIELIKETK